MPLFTVAIPTYNRAEKLAYTMSCVLQQTFTDFELIVSDNASPDHTAEVVRRFNDARIRYVRHSENIGAYANWANCTDIAQGDWLVFNQDDDLLCPIFLERCANAIRKHPQIVMYATECTMSRDVRSLYATKISNFPLHHHWDRPQPRLIPGLQIAALNFFMTGFFPPAQAIPTPLLREHFPRGADAELLSDRYVTWRVACEGTVAFEAYIGALLGDHGDRGSVTKADIGRRSADANSARLYEFLCERHLDWQSALRTILPEIRREFREWVFQGQPHYETIPAAAFEILAEELASEQGVSPAEYVAAFKVRTIQKFWQPVTDAQPPPRRGRLDRFGVPKPLIRIIRRCLAALGKKY